MTILLGGSRRARLKMLGRIQVPSKDRNLLPISVARKAVFKYPNMFFLACSFCCCRIPTIPFRGFPLNLARVNVVGEGHIPYSRYSGFVAAKCHSKSLCLKTSSLSYCCSCCCSCANFSVVYHINVVVSSWLRTTHSSISKPTRFAVASPAVAAAASVAV